MFDCKNLHCQKLLDEHAPLIFESISDEDRIHFEIITKILDEMEIPYFHDNKLVRGLDYYSHTTFEITSTALGAQDALCGGGRYNGLIENLSTAAKILFVLVSIITKAKKPLKNSTHLSPYKINKLIMTSASCEYFIFIFSGNFPI